MSTPEATEGQAGLLPGDVEEMLDRQVQVLEMIARAAPLPEVLTGIVTSLEQLMPGSHCSVLLLNRHQRTLHHGAAPSLPDPYVAAIDGMAIGEHAGSCGTAAATNSPVVAIDVRTDPRWPQFRDAAVSAGLASCWSTPVRGRDGSPVGTFAVYHAQPHQPTSRDQLLIERHTHLASVAIDHAALIDERLATERERRARLEAETARRTAEELLAAKSELLAAVGHEARTPIQAIVGFAELLRTIDLDQSRRREALAHISAAASHVTDLLADVLDLSRLEANALPLELEPVRLREVSEEAFGLLATKADQRRFTVVQRLGDEVVIANPRRLRQVLLNLVANAIRHGNVGGRVELLCDGTTNPSTLLVTIDDDGPGIPPDLVPRIFKPFVRANRPHLRTAAQDLSDSTQEESIGLGLGLAHGLVEAMGGELSIGSTGPTGTSMHLSLRRA